MSYEEENASHMRRRIHAPVAIFSLSRMPTPYGRRTPIVTSLKERERERERTRQRQREEGQQ
jgi:hypothetical protein